MAALVPTKRTNPRYQEVKIGAPVRGRVWRDLTLLLHWVRAHGFHLIPATSPHILLAADSSTTMRWRVQPSGLAIARVWMVTLRSNRDLEEPDELPPEIDVTYPDGGVVRYRPEVLSLPFGAPGTISRRIYIENLSAKSGAATELALTFAHARAASAAAWIETVCCFELPRSVLTQDSTDRGVDLETVRPGAAIYNGASVFRSVASAHGWANTEPRRHLAQLWLPTVSVSSGSFVDIFELPVPITPRKEGSTVTSKSVTWDVYARSSDGSTNVEIRISTALAAATATVSFTASTTFAWRGTSVVNARCEDLDQATGLPSGNFETFQIAARRTAGAGAVEIQGVDVWEAA